jgi:hypothetical protein
MDPNLKVKAYVINLDSRKDRWSSIQDNFKAIESIELIRVPAILDRRGSIGCAKSHLKIVSEAKARGDPLVLVLEDDATVKNPTQFDLQWRVIYEWLRDHINDWEIFNGGPGFWGGGCGVDKIIDLDRRIMQIRGGLCTHFICYSSKIYDRILTWTENSAPIDVFLAGRCKMIAPYPLLSVQRPNHSNNWNRHTDYTGNYNAAEGSMRSALQRNQGKK